MGLMKGATGWKRGRPFTSGKEWTKFSIVALAYASTTPKGNATIVPLPNLDRRIWAEMNGVTKTAITTCRLFWILRLLRMHGKNFNSARQVGIFCCDSDAKMARKIYSPTARRLA